MKSRLGPILGIVAAVTLFSGLFGLSPDSASSAVESCSLSSIGQGASANSSATQCKLVLSRSNISPGETVAVSGDGIRPHADVALSVEPRVLHSRTQTGDTGEFRLRVRIPHKTRPGSYVVMASGFDPAGRTVYLTAQLLVGPRASAGRPGGAHAIGPSGAVIAVADLSIADERELLLISLSFVLVASAVILRARRRSSTSTPL